MIIVTIERPTMSVNSSEIVISKGVGVAEREAVERYIRNISTKNLLPILSPEHFSHMTNVRVESLYAMSNAADRFYRTFDLRKKSGGKRRIDAPLPSLAYVQRWILENVLNRYQLHPASKAYRVGFSIVDNAKFHKRQGQILQLDVKDFFGSIKERHVYSMFYDFGYTKSVSTMLSKIVTFRGVLPQGAPTSGALTNMYMLNFDERVFNYCKSNKIRFSRYADDMTFSGSDFDSESLRALVERELSKADLSLNHSKTRLRKRHVRQEVTGIVVNDRLSIPADFRRKLRQECYYIKKFGLFGHVREVGHADPRMYLEQIIGRLAHVMLLHGGEKYWSDAHADMLALRSGL